MEIKGLEYFCHIHSHLMYLLLTRTKPIFRYKNHVNERWREKQRKRKRYIVEYTWVGGEL